MNSTSPLAPDIERVIAASGTDKVLHFYNATIHTEEYDMKAMVVVNIEFDNDYANRVGEYVFIDMLMPMGDVMKHVIPFRNNLEITLDKISGGVTTSKRYKFILLNMDENIASSRYQVQTLEEMNRTELVGLSGQCLDRYVEAVRTVDAHGIYRDTNVENILKLGFSQLLSDVFVNGESVTQILDVVTPDNDRVYDHVIIPSGTKIVDLPFFLQETSYGVYNTSIGLFITEKDKKSVASIYPLYNTKVNRETIPTLTIYSDESIRYEMIENTFILDGDDLFIVTSANKRHIDTGDDTYMNDAVGFTARKATRVSNNPVMAERGQSESVTSDTNVSMYMKERSDGIGYKKHIPTTDNLYDVRSQYTAKAGTFVQVRWNASNHDYLYPGMVVQYAFVRDNDVVIIPGVLHGFYSLYNGEAKKTNTLLNIFLEKDPYVRD